MTQKDDPGCGARSLLLGKLGCGAAGRAGPPWDPSVFSFLSGKSLPARAQAQTLPEARFWLCQSKTSSAPSEMRTRPASARRRMLPWV